MLRQTPPLFIKIAQIHRTSSKGKKTDYNTGIPWVAYNTFSPLSPSTYKCQEPFAVILVVVFSENVEKKG